VTTETLTPWQAHKKYGERATCETWIEEAKSQMGLGKTQGNKYSANESWPSIKIALLRFNAKLATPA
jgi:hypothetical protein